MSTVRSEMAAPGVTVVTLDRPRQLNAMNAELIEDLHHALAKVGADPDCRVIVLAGAGRAFCAGLDLGGYGTPPGGLDEGSPQRGLRMQQHLASLIPRLRGLRQPVVAAIQGAAAGGGLALALASDVRVASESATFHAAFVRVGLSGCDMGVSWILPRLVGASRAFELMLTGRPVKSGEALGMGLVAQVVPDDGLLGAAVETASLIAANSPFGVWMTKEVMWSNLETPSLQAAIDLENRTQILAWHTEDHAEAVAAFHEKRSPKFANH